MKANEKQETEAAAPTAITRDSVRAEIEKIISAIGAEKRKAISTEEFQVITAVLLERLAGVEKSLRLRILAVLKLMDANASAMRQRLFESKKSASTPAQDAIAEKYANL